MFGENIKKLRLSLGMNQIEFGNCLNVTKQSVSNWENGNIQPSIDMLIKISKKFSISSDYLLGISEERGLDTKGLTDKQLTYIQLLIDDIRK